MAKSNSRHSYQDCFDLLDLALGAAKGSRIKIVDHSAAVHLRSRIHYARQIDRDDNADVYAEGHPLHNRSPYDPIVCKIKKERSGWWLYLVKSDQMEYRTEETGEDDGVLQGSGRDSGEVEGEEETPSTPKEEERRA